MSPLLLRMNPYEFFLDLEEKAPAVVVRTPPKRPEEPVMEEVAP